MIDKWCRPQPQLSTIFTAWVHHTEVIFTSFKQLVFFLSSKLSYTANQHLNLVIFGPVEKQSDGELLVAQQNDFSPAWSDLKKLRFSVWPSTLD